MKNITYLSSAVQKEIDDYPESVRDRINYELTAMQTDCPHAFDDFDFEEAPDEALGGDDPMFSPAQKKSMRETIGRFAMQLTIKSKDSFRVIYVAKFPEAIYVLHTFKKKSEGVMKKDYRTAEQRYKALEQHRREQGLDDKK